MSEEAQETQPGRSQVRIRLLIAGAQVAGISLWNLGPDARDPIPPASKATAPQTGSPAPASPREATINVSRCEVMEQANSEH